MRVVTGIRIRCVSPDPFPSDLANIDLCNSSCHKCHSLKEETFTHSPKGGPLSHYLHHDSHVNGELPSDLQTTKRPRRVGGTTKGTSYFLVCTRILPQHHILIFLYHLWSESLVESRDTRTFPMFSSTHVKETEGLYPVSSIYSFILKSSDDWDRPKTGKVFSLTPVLGDSTNSSVTTIETYPVVIVYSGPTYDPL